MQGGTTLAIGATTIGIATMMMGVTADDFLVIGNELISLSGATIGNGQISGVTRGSEGTSAAEHADGAAVKHLKRYAGVGTVTSEVTDTGTAIGITTTTNLSAKVNAGGFLDIDAEFVTVSSLLSGGTTSVRNVTEQKDWFGAVSYTHLTLPTTSTV